ncbi:hypothetical protein HK097_011502 [Rhizophlyctis rosea]|uniref:Uncharacterized protein n=1 Tax=Rhizophlyctis rosea TaxID=64517 RepID=A0AAD5WZV1_9FUNG|nr:hypothetical protein HK097_011502 [Rhizophlyctis rosea]
MPTRTSCAFKNPSSRSPTSAASRKWTKCRSKRLAASDAPPKRSRTESYSYNDDDHRDAHSEEPQPDSIPDSTLTEAPTSPIESEAATGPFADAASSANAETPTQASPAHTTAGSHRLDGVTTCSPTSYANIQSSSSEGALSHAETQLVSVRAQLVEKDAALIRAQWELTEKNKQLDGRMADLVAARAELDTTRN